MYFEIVLGILLGIGISFGFMKLEIFKKTELHGPNSNKIIKEIYYCEKSKKYYRFIPEVCFHPL